MERNLLAVAITLCQTVRIGISRGSTFSCGQCNNNGCTLWKHYNDRERTLKNEQWLWSNHRKKLKCKVHCTLSYLLQDRHAITIHEHLIRKKKEKWTGIILIFFFVLLRNSSALVPLLLFTHTIWSYCHLLSRHTREDKKSYMK